MSEVSKQTIVVGVSAAGESDGAVRFAVDEALRHDCGITIVHALSPSIPPPPAAVGVIKDSEESEKTHYFADRTEAAEAERLVVEVARKARAMSDGHVDVITELPIGRRVHAIVEAAENARLIVVQHRDLPALERIFVRSTSAGVSARAHCPVVTVPPSWDAEVSHNRVTVGIDHLDNATDVLRIAFESAVSRTAGLKVVHAWKRLNADPEVVVSRSLEDEWQTRSERELGQLLEPWKREFPGVAVEEHAVQQSPTKSLLEFSRDSDLLILGRTKAALRLPLPLGTIARAMVKGARCPVEIVPLTTSATAKPATAPENSETDSA